MSAKKISGGLIILGVALILIFAFLSGRMAGLRPILILGIEISALLILFCVWFVLADVKEKDHLKQYDIGRFFERALNLPIIVWVLTGFLIIYLMFFIAPLFLNPDLQMQYFAGYIPNLNPIGNDLTVMVGQIKAWVATDRSPYDIQFYPPLTYILFAPLLLIKDYAALYRFFTLFTFAGYCLLALLLPLKMLDKRNLPLILLFFVTGLASYGLQFEMERGQYNVFTFLLCMVSIYIFHYHKKYRLLAYFLFSLSVQLKIYPAIFIVMFVDDWRDWKNTILRFAGIGAFNFLLLFVMGYNTFLDFVRAVFAQVTAPAWIGPENHSISSFISTLRQDGLGLMDMETLRALRHNPDVVKTPLIVLFVVFFITALVIFYLRREAGIDPYLLLTCTIGALILPISYDYTLSILGTPVVLFLSDDMRSKNPVRKIIYILLILAISLAYASTLVPARYRPHVLVNIFPALFLIVVLVTTLNVMRYFAGKRIDQSDEERGAAKGDAPASG